MKISNKIPTSVIQAAAAMFSPYIPEINPQNLIQALRDFSSGKENENIERPLTRKEAAEILSISLPTVNRLLNSGILRRIRISRKFVRIDPASVKNLINQ